MSQESTSALEFEMMAQAWLGWRDANPQRFPRTGVLQELAAVACVACECGKPEEPEEKMARRFDVFKSLKSVAIRHVGQQAWIEQRGANTLINEVLSELMSRNGEDMRRTLMRAINGPHIASDPEPIHAMPSDLWTQRPYELRLSVLTGLKERLADPATHLNLVNGSLGALRALPSAIDQSLAYWSAKHEKDALESTCITPVGVKVKSARM
jgi:hypothetical protein